MLERWARLMRVVKYLHFALNKFDGLEYYTLIKCFVFHTSSTKLNPCTNFSQSSNVHPQLGHSLVKFMNIESHYPLSDMVCENIIFLSHW